MPHTHTTTYATLPVSRAAFDEVWRRLNEASYTHLLREGDTPLIVLGEIALTPLSEEAASGDSMDAEPEVSSGAASSDLIHQLWVNTFNTCLKAMAYELAMKSADEAVECFQRRFPQ